MTFTELINYLTVEQVNTWWEELTKLGLQRQLAPSWKYKLKKNGSVKPFKSAIRDLANTYNLSVDNFTSDLSNRNKFCEKFNFEIEEELIFDRSELSELNSLYSKLQNKGVFFDYVNYAHKVITTLDVDPYKVRMGIRQKTAMVIIGMRGVLYYSEKNDKISISLILSDSFWNSRKLQYPNAYVLKFEGVGERSFVNLQIRQWNDLDIELLNNNQEQIKEEYNYVKNREIAKWNQEAKTTNSALKYLIFKNPDINTFLTANHNFESNAEDQMDKELTEILAPLNQILFGPPGTGKTYHTINKALSIIENKTEDALKLENRNALKERYETYIKSGQIVFTTFHQSMSYEDFIEGIKPITQNQNVVYEIENGIFKQIAELASTNFNQIANPKNDFEEVLEHLKDLWLESDNNEIEVKMKDKSFWITDITFRNINFRKASGGTGHNLAIKTLKALYNNERQMESGLAIYYFPLIEKLKTFSKQISTGQSTKQYVVIIDEINRGNVSQIFGELITLIEDNKRLGEVEELQIKLPYSKELFGIPPNLYLIGTMNTADRSVEALDTALRRRFVFEELSAKPILIGTEGLSKNSQGVIDGVDMVKMLETINKRIELLLDKDHQIGHAFFLNVNNIEELRNAFKQKIIPLLQEYFYGDIGKICLVLGDSFIKKNEAKVLKLYASKKYDADIRTEYESKSIYEIEATNNWDFKSIYESPVN